MGWGDTLPTLTQSSAPYNPLTACVLTCWLLAVLKHIHGRDNKKCNIHARNKRAVQESTSGKIKNVHSKLKKQQDKSYRINIIDHSSHTFILTQTSQLSHHWSPGLIKHSPPSCILESKFLQVEDLTQLSQPHLKCRHSIRLPSSKNTLF